MTLGVAIFASAVVYLFIKYIYVINPGASTERHLWANLKNYITPWYYRRSEITYGLISPSGMSFIWIPIAGTIVWRGWGKCSIPVQRHIMMAAAINFPLFLMFAATGELRNLSLLFVGLTILLAKALEQPGQAYTYKHIAIRSPTPDRSADGG